MNLDLAVVAKALESPHGVTEVKERGVTAAAFLDEGRKAWEYVEQFARDHGVNPSVQLVEGVIGRELPKPPDLLAFYLGELVLRWQLNIAADAMELVRVAAVKKAPGEVAIALAEGAAKIMALHGTKDSLLNFNSEEVLQRRLADYAKAKAIAGAVDGFHTPWPTIDNATHGIHEDEMWVVLGAKKAGKTWATMLMALKVWSDGANKVLVVSEEMGVWKIMRRIDAIRAKLPYGEFVTGKLPTPSEDRWLESSRSTHGKEPFLVAGRSRASNVAELEALVRATRPRCIFIDGAYFLDSGGAAKSKWDRTSAVVDQLQAMVQRIKIPVVLSWQFNRGASKTKGGKAGEAGSEDIAFAYELAMNADVVLGIYRDDTMAKDKEAIVRIIESREGPKEDPIRVKYDFSTMEFHELGKAPKDGEAAPEAPAASQQTLSAQPQAASAPAQAAPPRQREPGDDDDEDGPPGGLPAQGINF